MPYELCIPISSESCLRTDLAQQRGLHAIFFAALETADPTLSQHVHNSRRMPFAQALLSSPKQEGGTWRVTLLDDTLYEPFIIGLGQIALIRLTDQKISIHTDAVEIEHKAYDNLQQEQIHHRYTFSFATPTSFKQRIFHQPLPDPYSCFQSWWMRWQHFAPPELGINIAVLDIVRAHIAVGAFRLISQTVMDGPRCYVGAVGKITFLIRQPNKVDKHWWQDVATLAAYAPYCGTGYKTTQGFGQTTLVSW